MIILSSCVLVCIVGSLVYFSLSLLLYTPCTYFAQLTVCAEWRVDLWATLQIRGLFCHLAIWKNYVSYHPHKSVIGKNKYVNLLRLLQWFLAYSKFTYLIWYISTYQQSLANQKMHNPPAFVVSYKTCLPTGLMILQHIVKAWEAKSTDYRCIQTQI